MKTLLTSVAVLMIASATLTQGDRTPAGKSDNSQTVKVSALKLAEAKAFLSRINTRQIRINPATADGGI